MRRSEEMLVHYCLTWFCFKAIVRISCADAVRIPNLDERNQKEITNNNYCHCVSFGSLEESCFKPIPTNRSCPSDSCPVQKINYCAHEALKEFMKYGDFFYAREGCIPLISSRHKTVYSLKRGNLTLRELKNFLSPLAVTLLPEKSFKISMKRSTLDSYKTLLPSSRIINLFVDWDILHKIFTITGAPFRFHIEMKAAHYPNTDWNSCSTTIHFNKMFANLHIKIYFKYYAVPRTNFSVEGLTTDTKMDRSIILHPNSNVGQIMSILYFDPGIKNVGFQFYCCFNSTTDKPLGYSRRGRHILFPHFIRMTNDLPSQPKNVSVSAVRMYYNSSIEFTLEWGCQMDWNGTPKSYEILCKFYDIENSNYFAHSCSDCFADSTQKFKTCQKCWQKTFSNFHFSGPYLFAEKRWDEHKHTFIVQTNLNNFFQNENLIWEKVKANYYTKQSFLVDFDAFNAVYNHYNIKVFQSPEEYSILQGYLKNSVVFPTPHLNPRQFQPEKIKKTFALCAIRGKKASGLAGEWSSPVKLSFTHHTQATILISILKLKMNAVYFNDETIYHINEVKRLIAMKISQHDSGFQANLNDQPFITFKNEVEYSHIVSTWLKNAEYSHVATWFHFSMAHVKPVVLIAHSENRAISIVSQKRTHGDTLENSRQHLTEVGCYHWIFNVWYAFVLDRNSGKYNLSMFHGDTGNIPFDEVPWINLLKTDGIPLAAKCPPLHSFIIWTERVGESIKVWRANLSHQTGTVILPPHEIPESQMCDCGKVKKISSHAIELYYRNVDTLEQPTLLTACNRVICATQLDKDKRLKRSDSIKLPGHLQNVISIAADTNGIYLLFEDDKHFFYKYRAISKEWMKYRHFDLESRLLKPEQPELYPAYKVFFTDKLCLGPILQKGCAKITVDNFYQIATQTTAEMLPIPPVQCMFPKVGHANIKMLSESSNEITVHVTWKTNDECEGLAKPSVILQVKYSLITNDISRKDISLFNCTVLACLMKKSDPSTSESVQLALSHLINHRFYYFEIDLLPALSAKLHMQWYTGQTYNFLSKIYKTAYEPQSDDVISRIALGISIAVMTIILLLLAVIVRMYNRTWYLYRTLQRLSVRDVVKREKLGEGHYGEVWKAAVKGKLAVIKILKESATYLVEKEFRDEALILSKLRCENIIKPLGICLQTRPIMLALEYMNGGSVESYLRNENVRTSIDGSDLFLLVQDALKGCQYLESEGYIHGDLAARNCLVQTVSNTNLKPKFIKLSDFGLAKDVGSDVYKRKNPEQDIPVAWAAPEAFEGTFSSKSDIWSFGVLIWEVFSWASQPYGCCHSDSHHCPLENHSNYRIEVMVKTENKSLADLPDPCVSEFPHKLKELMKWCWSQDPDERPSFTQLSKFLLKIRAELAVIKWIHGSQACTSGSPANPLEPAYSGSECQPAYEIQSCTRL